MLQMVQVQAIIIDKKNRKSFFVNRYSLFTIL